MLSQTAQQFEEATLFQRVQACFNSAGGNNPMQLLERVFAMCDDLLPPPAAKRIKAALTDRREEIVDPSPDRTHLLIALLAFRLPIRDAFLWDLNQLPPTNFSLAPQQEGEAEVVQKRTREEEAKHATTMSPEDIEFDTPQSLFWRVTFVCRALALARALPSSTAVEATTARICGLARTLLYPEHAEKLALELANIQNEVLDMHETNCAGRRITSFRVLFEQSLPSVGFSDTELTLARSFLGQVQFHDVEPAASARTGTPP